MANKKEVTTVHVYMPSAKELLEQYGLEKNGAVQEEWKRLVLNRIRRYMPNLTGKLIEGMDRESKSRSADEIFIPGPYARYLYYGKVMVNAKTGKGPMLIPGVGLRYRKNAGVKLKATERDLTYTKENSAQAGPFWDRRLMAAEGDVLIEELREYIKREVLADGKN